MNSPPGRGDRRRPRRTRLSAPAHTAEDRSTGTYVPLLLDERAPYHLTTGKADANC
jgi:hypothetical protein